MELDPQTMRSVWWRGAIGSAIKGIPQGLALGLLGAGILFGAIALLGSIGATAGIGLGLAKAFGAFLYAAPVGATLPAFSLSALNVLPIVALNTVLTAVGNFLTGGQIACNAYKQDVEHRMNASRINAIEARETALEQRLPAPSATVQRIVANGPRTQQSFAQATAQERNSTSSEPTLH